MKTIFAVLMILTIPIMGQEVRKTLNSKDIFGITCTHTLKYSVSGETDSIEFITLLYQNNRYSTLTDIGGFFFDRQDDLDAFKSELKSTLDFIKSNPNVEFTNGHFSVYEFAPKSIYLSDEKEKSFRGNLKIFSELLLFLDSCTIR